jgi:ubiquitin-protein ligase
MSLNEIFRNKRRIYQEYKKFYKDCYSDIYTFLELSHLTVLLEVNGPKNSIYENKKYKIKMTLTNGYPFAPPKVEFLTPIIHPNIYKGQICVDMLTYNWTPAYTIHTIMIVIYNLLTEPDISDISNMKLTLSSNHAIYKKTSMRHFRVWGGRRDFMLYLAGMGLLEKEIPNENYKDNYSKLVEKNKKSKNALDVFSMRDYIYNILSYL